MNFVYGWAQDDVVQHLVSMSRLPAEIFWTLREGLGVDPEHLEGSSSPSGLGIPAAGGRSFSDPCVRVRARVLEQDQPQLGIWVEDPPVQQRSETWIRCLHTTGSWSLSDWPSFSPNLLPSLSRYLSILFLVSSLSAFSPRVLSSPRLFSFPGSTNLISFSGFHSPLHSFRLSFPYALFFSHLWVNFSTCFLSSPPRLPPLVFFFPLLLLPSFFFLPIFFSHVLSQFKLLCHFLSCFLCLFLCHMLLIVPFPPSSSPPCSCSYLSSSHACLLFCRFCFLLPSLLSLSPFLVSSLLLFPMLPSSYFLPFDSSPSSFSLFVFSSLLPCLCSSIVFHHSFFIPPLLPHSDCMKASPSPVCVLGGEAEECRSRNINKDKDIRIGPKQRKKGHNKGRKELMRKTRLCWLLKCTFTHNGELRWRSGVLEGESSHWAKPAYVWERERESCEPCDWLNSARCTNSPKQEEERRRGGGGCRERGENTKSVWVLKCV